MLELMVGYDEVAEEWTDDAVARVWTTENPKQRKCERWATDGEEGNLYHKVEG